MKKDQVLMIKEELKRTRTDTLQKFIDEMAGIMHDRELSKTMWFWKKDNGNRYIRNSKEKYYYRNINIKMGRHELSYYRNVSMSRKNVYVDEYLGFDNEKITVADLIACGDEKFTRSKRWKNCKRLSNKRAKKQKIGK